MEPGRGFAEPGRAPVALQGPCRFAEPASSRPGSLQAPLSCRMHSRSRPLHRELEAAGGGEAAGALCPAPAS